MHKTIKISSFLFLIVPLGLIFSVLFLQSSKHVETVPLEPVEFKRYLSHDDSMIYRYDTLLTRLIDSSDLVGAAAVIVMDGKIKYLKCFGVKKAGESSEVDAGTIFRLASVSKPITGTLAGIMAHDNIIGLDDKVIDYLPNFRLKDSTSTREISVRNLLSHTSGLVPHAYDNLVEDGVPFSVIIDSLFRVNISDRPGRLYGYQNVLFSLYDTISVIKTGKSFENLLTEKVFKPFNMYHASASIQGFMNSQNIAYPHGRYGGLYKAINLNDRYYNTKPAAGINASISDLGNFLSVLTNEHPEEINPAVIDTVLYPQVRSPLRWVYLRHWNGVKSKDYGLGWRIIGYHNTEVAYHGGYVRGYRAEIAVCRKEGVGIAFLTNSPGRVGSQIVPSFFDMYFQNLIHESKPLINTHVLTDAK